MKLLWSKKKEQRIKQSQAEKEADKLKAELAERKAKLLSAVMELSKEHADGR